jgi:hypothetical protein
VETGQDPQAAPGGGIPVKAIAGRWESRGIRVGRRWRATGPASPTLSPILVAGPFAIDGLRASSTASRPDHGQTTDWLCAAGPTHESGGEVSFRSRWRPVSAAAGLSGDP